MRTKLIMLFLTAPIFLFAQNPPKTLNLKLYYAFEKYSNNYYELLDYSDATIFSVEDYRLGNMAFSIPFPKGKIYQEITLSSLKFDWKVNKEIKRTKDGIITSSSKLDDEASFALLKFMYEFGFNNQSQKRIKPMLSAGIEPFLWYKGVLPINPTMFPVYNTRIGTTIFIIPRLTYDFNDLVYFDLNLPLGLFHAFYDHEKYLDPSLSLDEQRTDQFDLSFLSNTWQIRLGIGFRI